MKVIVTQDIGCGETKFESNDGIVVGNFKYFCSGALIGKVRWQAGFGAEGMLPVSTPVENLGTQFYGYLNAPYLNKSTPKTVWDNAYYEFHGALPFDTGQKYTFTTRLTGFVGGVFTPVSITIPFILGKSFGHQFIILDDVIGGIDPLDLTSSEGRGQCGQTTA